MSIKIKLKLIAIIISLVSIGSVHSGQTKAPTTAKHAKSPIILSAPPKNSEQEARERYEPVANYLSQVLGKKVVYRHPSSWRDFHSKMRKGQYDLVFDGAHLNSYRIQNLNHNVLAKAPNKKQYVVVIKLDSLRYKKIQDLVGRTICAPAPPELSTAIVMKKFDNPMRQPLIINTQGAKNVFEGIMKRKCEAGIIALSDFKKIDPHQTLSRAIYVTKSIPAQAFSASPRLSKKDQNRIRKALTSASSSKPTEKLRSAFNVGERFTAGSNSEYIGLAQYVDNALEFN